MAGKKSAINRLESMRPLRAKVEESYRKISQAAQDGSPVAWSMATDYGHGQVILKAMGVEIIFPENYGATCAFMDRARPYLDRSDADGFPTHLCGYSRNHFGYVSSMIESGSPIPPEAPMGGLPKPTLLMGSNEICDARYKWFQALNRYIDAPLYILHMPTPGVKELAREGVYERCIRLMVDDLKEFVIFLERILGTKMDWDRLDAITRQVEQANLLWHQINELRKARPCPMHSRDFWTCMPPALFTIGDLEETATLYREMYNEVKDRVDRGIGSVAEEKYRIVFSDLPPWHSLGFFDTLAERGWNFVIESSLYRPPIPLDITGVSDPLERIAMQHLHFSCGHYGSALQEGEPFGYPAYPYHVYARDYRCDGALLHPLVTCRSGSVHHPYVEEMLMRKLKIPSMIAEGDIVDLRLFNAEQILSRAQPFEETMDYYRAVRKKEGFDW